THEGCLYTVGLGAGDIVLDAFQHADLVICLGYDMIEWHPEKWNIGEKKKIIHIDTRPAEVDNQYVTDVEIIGSISETLEALLERLGDEHVKDTPAFADSRALMTHDLHMNDHDDGFPIKPQRALHDIRKALADDDILISDVGAHKMWVARHYLTHAPKSCFITNGLCSMGFALPAAISAKRLYPDKRVLALSGDGGFLMNVQDLITAVRYNTPIVAMIWNDDDYGLIRWKQNIHFGKSSHTDLVNPNFVALAESFGCQGIKVESAAGLSGALEKAFADTSRPTVIEVPIDYSENAKLTERLGELLSH
ncbi:MAG: acetolactate synthase large subunit, partial [candidate division Zixibacteria bacterium]|nr:acetolactate synthase large subunit [candidate division Zixibacteria bacterium]